MRKYLIAVLFSCLIFSGLAQAQDAPPQNFIISLSSAAYTGTSGTQPVAIGSAGFQLTKSISLAYEQISNPTDSSARKVYSGVANYTRGLDSLIPAKLKAKLLFDSSNYLVTFQAGAGRESLPGLTPGAPRSSHITANLGLYGGRQVAAHAQLGGGLKFLVGPRFETIKVPVGTLNFTF